MIKDKNEFEEILNLLKKTFSSQYKDEIDSAEKKLKELGKLIFYNSN